MHIISPFESWKPTMSMTFYAVYNVCLENVLLNA